MRSGELVTASGTGRRPRRHLSRVQRFCKQAGQEWLDPWPSGLGPGLELRLRYGQGPLRTQSRVGDERGDFSPKVRYYKGSWFSRSALTPELGVSDAWGKPLWVKNHARSELCSLILGPGWASGVN